jgi:8-oxo-dGTP pyrophosphatase MutT (NUDIX family)
MHLSEDFAGWPPEKTVFPVAAVNLHVLDGEHPYCQAKREDIARNWDAEVTANAALFDGRMVFQHRLALAEDGIAGQGYIVPFSTLMYWRRQQDRGGAMHLFAYPVIESSDGALVAIRMGAHTANAGQVYFACGSLETADVFDGRCDIDYNMRREVLEETGLDLAEARPGEGYHASHFRRALNIFRMFSFDMTADEMIERIERHMTVAEDQEIAGAVAIRSADHSAYPYNVGMLPVIDWYFARRNQA